MDPVTLAFIGSALNFMATKGLKAAQLVITELADKGDPTLAEIEALDVLVKDPESYFEEAGE
ncbi:MAG: hypothetical protein JRI34_05620 [Deltaproteobacteria bacterium]|nr:hypothetical protein [Deltaproteobacteria bacterium]